MTSASSGGKQHTCCHCGRQQTPCWRRGPPEKPILCNACGSRWLVKGTLEGYMPGAKAAATVDKSEMEKRAPKRKREHMEMAQTPVPTLDNPLAVEFLYNLFNSHILVGAQASSTVTYASETSQEREAEEATFTQDRKPQGILLGSQTSSMCEQNFHTDVASAHAAALTAAVHAATTAFSTPPAAFSTQPCPTASRRPRKQARPVACC